MVKVSCLSATRGGQTRLEPLQKLIPIKVLFDLFGGGRVLWRLHLTRVFLFDLTQSSSSAKAFSLGSFVKNNYGGIVSFQLLKVVGKNWEKWKSLKEKKWGMKVRKGFEKLWHYWKARRPQTCKELYSCVCQKRSEKVLTVTSSQSGGLMEARPEEEMSTAWMSVQVRPMMHKEYFDKTEN